MHVLYLYLAWPNYGLDVLNITMHTEVVKVNFLMNFNMTLTVLNLHQKTHQRCNKIFKGQGHYDKVKGQIKVSP